MRPEGASKACSDFVAQLAMEFQLPCECSRPGQSLPPRTSTYRIKEIAFVEIIPYVA